MGKGDKKTAKGKRFMGSYGVTRPKKKKKPGVWVKASPNTENKASAKKATAPKTTKKKAATKKTTKKKATAKKTATKKK